MHASQLSLLQREASELSMHDIGAGQQGKTAQDDGDEPLRAGRQGERESTSGTASASVSSSRDGEDDDGEEAMEAEKRRRGLVLHHSAGAALHVRNGFGQVLGSPVATTASEQQQQQQQQAVSGHPSGAQSPVLLLKPGSGSGKGLPVEAVTGERKQGEPKAAAAAHPYMPAAVKFGGSPKTQPFTLSPHLRAQLSPRAEPAKGATGGAAPLHTRSASRHTLPSSLSTAFPRLPFFPAAAAASTSPTAATDSKATSKTAGPAGYLASLQPSSLAPVADTPPFSPSLPAAAAASSPAAAPVLPAPSAAASTRSLSPPTPSSRGTVGGSSRVMRASSFFSSVAGALGRLSLSQRTGAAAPAVRPKHALEIKVGSRRSSESTVRAAGKAAALVAGEKTAADWDEVTPLSPCFLAPPSPPFCPPAAARPPLSSSACVFHHGVLPGNYSQQPHALPASASSSAPAPFPLSSSLVVDEQLLANWTESDDPMSPASFQEVVPGVYLGSAKSVMNLDRLLQHRITHVLTVMNRPLNFLAQPGDAADADIFSFSMHRKAGQAGSVQPPCLPCSVPSSHPLFTAVMHGLTVNFVYLLDLPEADLLSALTECIPFLSHAHLAQHGRVLIHCQAGISRSASVVIAYLLACNPSWSVKDAWDVCAASRPYINPNEGFVSQLEMYSKQEQRKRGRTERRWRDRLQAGWVRSSRGRELLRRERGQGVRAKALPQEARRRDAVDSRVKRKPGNQLWWWRSQQ